MNWELSRMQAKKKKKNSARGSGPLLGAGDG